MIKLSEFDIFDFLFIGAVVPSGALGRKELSPRADPSQLLFCLKKWIHRFKNKNPVWALKLSGGLDSRFVLCLLREGGIHEMKIHTYYNPDIGAELDADVYCSQKAVQTLNIKAHHMFKPGLPSEYLMPFDSTPEISAIFATELLGGQMFRQIPIQLWVQNYDLDEILRWIPIGYMERFKTIYFHYIDPMNMNFFLKTFTSSPLSQIYNSEESLSWSHPFVLFHEFHSPFSDREFVSELAGYNAEEVVDYRLYDQVIKEFKNELLSAPIVSDYSMHFPTQVPPKNFINSKNTFHHRINRPSSREEFSPTVIDFIQRHNLNMNLDFIRSGLRRLSFYI